MAEEKLKSGQNRTEGQRELDLETTADLWTTGKTAVFIAGIIGVSRQTIHNDVKALVARWREAAFEKIDDQKAVELEKINRLEATYWDAWERSLTPGVTETDTKARERKNGDKRARLVIVDDRKTVKTEYQNGDSKYLEGVRWCIDKRCDILGVQPAETLNINMPGGGMVTNNMIVVREYLDDGQDQVIIDHE